MTRSSIGLAACVLLAACQSPAPIVSTVPAKRVAVAASSKTHHAVFANGRKSSGSEAQFATDCAWPVHEHGRGARPGSSNVQPGAAPKPADEVEGCAILRFSLSSLGKINWIEVVSAKPMSIGPLALKCLLAAKFKPDPHPEPTSLVRVDVHKLPGDVAIAALKLR